ncbi:hypothetical protein L7F22_050746 [Adiantum nelumboides]|nr:hypothetical protein [Adiantum nelumboides]MCO5596678.1 hypothetical protein [Adiantum nelumboides]
MEHQIKVQHPPFGPFNANQLNWVDKRCEKSIYGYVRVAYFPSDRLDDFLKGEETLANMGTNFRRHSVRRNTKGSLKLSSLESYLEEVLFWCAYGPKDMRGKLVMAPRTANTPKVGKGSRPGYQKGNRMCGCQCHFFAKRLYLFEDVTYIRYIQMHHVDDNDELCHKEGMVASLGRNLSFAPWLSLEIKSWVFDMLCKGYTPIQVHEAHIQVVHDKKVTNANYILTRDDFLSIRDILNISRKHASSTHELHPSDAQSVRMWTQQHSPDVFYYEEMDISQNKPFVLGIQTLWQLERLNLYGNNGVISMDSTFGTNFYKFQLYTILVFDTHQNGVPVAWVITSSAETNTIVTWLTKLRNRVLDYNKSWEANAFLVDDATAKINAIRRLGAIMNMRVEGGTSEAIALDNIRDSVVDFLKDFAHEHGFIDYFRTHWVTKVEMWARGVQVLPHANQDTNGTIQSYHVTLKLRFLCGKKYIWGRRIDWLLHKIMTSCLPYFWYVDEAKKGGFVRNKAVQRLIEHSIERAHSIQDGDVSFSHKSSSVMVRVKSQFSSKGVYYTVYNADCDWGCCNCAWAMKGNLCKHQVKVMLMKGFNLNTLVGKCFDLYHGGHNMVFASTNDSPISTHSVGEIDVSQMSGVKEQATKKFNANECYTQALQMVHETPSLQAHFDVLMQKVLLQLQEVQAKGLHGILHPAEDFQPIQDGFGNSIQRAKPLIERHMKKKRAAMAFSRPKARKKQIMQSTLDCRVQSKEMKMIDVGASLNYFCLSILICNGI